MKEKAKKQELVAGPYFLPLVFLFVEKKRKDLP